MEPHHGQLPVVVESQGRRILAGGQKTMVFIDSSEDVVASQSREGARVGGKHGHWRVKSSEVERTGSCGVMEATQCLGLEHKVK